MKTAWFRLASSERLLAVLLLLGTVALLYGHTLSVPFYLDDAGAIPGNYQLRDLSATLTQFFSQRGLTNLTFSLNFQFTGWALPPLHLTNIALHALCGLLVWLLFRQLIQGRWLPVLGALLFVAHPLQTQAVTYLVQRSAVLGAGFFVAAILCHRQARSALLTGAARSSIDYLKWYSGAVICGVAAILAKEHTVTLPLLLIVHDRLFPMPFKRSARQVFADYFPYFAASLLVGGWIYLSLARSGQVPSLDVANLTLEKNYPLHYLVTQFSVLWIYLRLLVLPYGQALEYDHPVVVELLTWQNGVALAGLLVVGWLVWRKRRSRPLLAFGAAWMVLALAVESSLIPLDPIFEHRLYLPMFGFVLVLLDSVPSLFGERRAWAIGGILLLIWMPLSWQRNDLWRDPLRFNEQNLSVAPQSARVYLALIYNYRDAGRIADAEQCAQQLLRIDTRSVIAHQELALLQAKQGNIAKGLATVEDGLKQFPQEPGLYKTGAQIYMDADLPRLALAFLTRGVDASPKSYVMYDQLAAALFELSDLMAAAEAYRYSLAINDNHAATHRNFGKVLYSQGRMAEALAQLRIAVQLEPWNPDAWEGLGISALALGDLQTALVAAKRLDRIDNDGARRLRDALGGVGQ